MSAKNWLDRFSEARAASVKAADDDHEARGYTAWGSGRSALRRGFAEGVLWVIEEFDLGPENAALLKEIIESEKPPPLVKEPPA
jgi:hypothetical protein